MRALVHHRFGGIETLRFEDVPEPVPGRGEVLVAVSAASVNPIDAKVRSGSMGPLVNKRFPKIPGADFAGRVAGFGEGVEGFAIGQRVFGARDPFAGGAFAERLAVKASQCAPIPDAIDDATAAALPIAGCAALGLLDALADPAGSRVLLHGASGGVGLFAIRLAAIRSARVVAVCGANALSLCRSLGADEVINYRSATVNTDSRFDLVANLSGRMPWAAGHRLLGPAGVLIEPSPTIPVFIGSIIANLFRSRKHVMLQTVARTGKLAELAGLVVSGTLPVAIAAQYPFDRAIDAYRDQDSGSTLGKRVVAIGAG